MVLLDFIIIHKFLQAGETKTQYCRAHHTGPKYRSFLYKRQNRRVAIWKQVM